MRIRRWTVAVLGIALLVPGPVTAEAADPFLIKTEIPLNGYGDTYLDETHEHVLISGGLDEARIVVTDTDAQVIDTLDNLPGAYGIARSETPDAVWVALSKADAVIEMSTVDYSELRRINFPAGACPKRVAQTGDKLIVQGSDNCSYSWPSFYTVDLAGTAEPVYWFGGAHEHHSIATSPGLPGFVLVAADRGWLRLYDVTGAAPVETASTFRENNSWPAFLNPAGTEIVVSGNEDLGIPIYSVPDLLLDDWIEPGTGTAFANWTADGSMMAAIIGIPDDDAIHGMRSAVRAWNPTTNEVIATSLLPDVYADYKSLVVSTSDMQALIVDWEGTPEDTMELVAVHLGETPRNLIVIADGIDDGRPDYLSATLYDSEFSEIATRGGDWGWGVTFESVYPGTYYVYVWDGIEGHPAGYFPQWWAGVPGGRSDAATPVVLTGDGDVVLEFKLYPVYEDTAGVFDGDIFWLGDMGITRGCNPPRYDQYCPDDYVTRGQMAAFLDRALDLPAATGIDFYDDDGSLFEPAIERLAAAGITKGCNPPGNTMFCPHQYVTRGQMAAFLHRALG